MLSIPDCVVRRARKPKPDWLPSAVKLYHDGLTGPQIHEALQSNGYTPSLRTVYNKLNSEGCPTCHGRQPKSQSAAATAFADSSDIPEFQQYSHMPVPEAISSTAPMSLPFRSHTQPTIANLSSMQPVGTSFNRTTGVFNYSPQASRYLDGHFMGKDFKGNVPSDHEERASQINPMDTTTGLYTPNKFLAKDSKTGQVHGLKKRKMSKITDTEVVPQKTQENIALFLQTGGRTRHAHWVREDTRVYRKYKQIRSFMASPKSKNKTPKTQAREGTLFADNDSGYYSVKTQPAISVRDSLVSYPGPVTSFQDLYKVVCPEHHEFKDLERYGEGLPCLFCGFSGIHSLALSAARLTLEEFLAKLTLKELYDPQAIDAAGNSALHYAAASGAGVDYLAALIDAGVPLYQRNTAGQNFLHCLRPCYVESYGSDCYCLGLIQLLELVDPKKMFDQQDNNGQTVLHVIASHITDSDLKAQIFHKFSVSGYPDIFLDRFGTYAMSWQEDWRMEQSISEAIEEDDPEHLQDTDWWNDTIHYPDEMGGDTMRPSFLDFEASIAFERGEISGHFLPKICDNPHYIDFETQDTILHILSRLNLQSKGSSATTDMIRCLKTLVARGVNLNWYNKQGQTPLIAFICNQSLRGNETGAILAEYMNILIGKDGTRKADANGGRNIVNIDMMNRRGATALHEACVGAHFAVACILIQAGANVNARLCNDPNGLSILQATHQERAKMTPFDPGRDAVRHSNFGEIISVLELNGAVRHPTMLQERGVHKSSS